MKPYVVGVAGGTGSGKTTIARRIAEALPTEMVTILEHDAYYFDRGDLTYEERCNLNFDHPDSLETSLLVSHIRALKHGQPIEVPMYDFKIHRRGPESKPFMWSFDHSNRITDHDFLITDVKFTKQCLKIKASSA